jgi:hypothetical protein
LVNDYVFTGKIEQTGGYVPVGYVDPITPKKALVGEKRIYARDSNGDAIVDLWLKNDGEAVLSQGIQTVMPLLIYG